jgi:transposase
MARTLSQDLRDRVVAAIDGGLSCRAAATRFGVGVSSAIRSASLAREFRNEITVQPSSRDC